MRLGWFVLNWFICSCFWAAFCLMQGRNPTVSEESAIAFALAWAAADKRWWSKGTL